MAILGSGANDRKVNTWGDESSTFAQVCLGSSVGKGGCGTFLRVWKTLRPRGEVGHRMFLEGMEGGWKERWTRKWEAKG